MKKIVSFLLCLMVLLLLFSCKSNQNQDDLPQNEETASSDTVDTDGVNEEIASSDTVDNDGVNEETASSDTVDNDGINDNTNIQLSEPERAIKMYDAAIKGEICVFNELLDEIKLEDCRFPSNDLRLGECEILSKAILDMDQDGISEYVIQSEAKDHIVLHYYDGKVYTYCFDSNDFYNLNTDGSFYWIDSCNKTRGLNQISFNGPSLSIKKIYKINCHDGGYYEGDEFYIGGNQITYEEFSDYYISNHKTGVIFSPLDISCEYPISSEKAYEIALSYWQIQNGAYEGALGSIVLSRIVILEKPNGDTSSYRIGRQMEYYRNHIPGGWYSMPTHSVSSQRELLIDAITGECLEEYNPYEFDY